MLDKIFPLKIYNYLELIRFSKPIGFMLLLWPCWLALLQIQTNPFLNIKWFILFFIGAFLMRSAGCIINDIIDINIDKNITRTSKRPLASKKISITNAIFLLIFLLLISFFILIQFNFISIITGLASLPLIICYPFMKRFINFPQLILGLIFNWGVIIVSLQFFNSLKWDYIILYVACIFWTLAYDTIYAYQDREDDVQNNIKSLAVLLNKKGKIFVKFFYLVFFLLIGYLSFKTNNNYLSLIVLIILIFGMNIILNKWEPTSRKSSNYYFKFNNFVGLCIFLFLFIF